MSLASAPYTIKLPRNERGIQPCWSKVRITESRTMTARGERCRCIPPGEARADRYAGAQPLGEGHYVGLNFRVLVGKPPTGAADASLDFVQHQQPPFTIADLTQLGQVAGIRQIDNTFSLHRFDQEHQQ